MAITSIRTGSRFLFPMPLLKCHDVASRTSTCPSTIQNQPTCCLLHWDHKFLMPLLDNLRIQTPKIAGVLNNDIVFQQRILCWGEENVVVFKVSFIKLLNATERGKFHMVSRCFLIVSSTPHFSLTAWHFDMVCLTFPSTTLPSFMSLYISIYLSLSNYVYHSHFLGQGEGGDKWKFFFCDRHFFSLLS